MTPAEILELIQRVAQKCSERAHGVVQHRQQQAARRRPAVDGPGLGQLAWQTADRRARRRFRQTMRRPLGVIARAERSAQSIKRRYRTTKTVAKASVKTTRFAGRTVYKTVRHPFRTALVIALIILLTPYTAEQFLNDGKRFTGALGSVLPSSYQCGKTAQPGGYLRLAADAGSALHSAAYDPPVTPARWQAMYEHAAKALGHFVGTFQIAATTGQVPTVPTSTDPATQVAALVQCCITTPAQGLPASWPTSDTPAMTAARAARAAGFTGDALVEAVAVAGAESGWDPTAANPASTARGLWQIMLSLHAPLLTGADWRDPLANARVAYALWQQSGWKPWTTWPTAAATYLPQARQAVAAISGVLGPAVPIAEPAADPVVPAATCVPTSGATGSAYVEHAIARAMTQLGVPYSWGGGNATGPTLGIAQGAHTVGFDCSGLIQYAYGLPGNPTTKTLIHMGTLIPPGQEQRGDLVLPSPDHVVLALGDGQAISAPHTGSVVSVGPYGRPWRVVRLAPTNAA